jgi:hypothetical protein
MRHSLAHLDEQFQPLPYGKSLLLAERGDRLPRDQLHHEEGPALRRRSGIEYLGNAGMVHQGQGLALRLEAGNYRAGIHTQLDELEGNLAHNRMLLARAIDGAEASFAERLDQLIASADFRIDAAIRRAQGRSESRANLRDG